MSAYLARLKNIDADNFTNTPYMEVPKVTKPPFGTFGTSLMGHIVKNNSDIEAVSNWWLVSYADIENVQLTIWPPCTHAEALAFNPTALSATPMQSPHMQAVNINTPQALLDLMRAGGYSVSVNGDSLEVSQARWIDAELADLITSHKIGLIEILESEI